MCSQSHAPPKRATILITRPWQQATRLAAQVQERFQGQVDIVTSSLITLEISPPPKVAAFRARSLILTSQTGAQCAGEWRDTLPSRAFCVGPHTAQLAARYGFDVLSVQDNAADLLTLVRQHPTEAPFLHLRGQESIGDIAQNLNNDGIACHDVIAYTQRPQPLSAQAQALLMTPKTWVIIPLYSPLTARLISQEWAELSVKQGQPPQANVTFVAISAATAAQIPAKLAQTLLQPPHIAARPNGQEMLNTLAKLLSKP